MKERIVTLSLVLFVILLLLDLYTFKGVRLLTEGVEKASVRTVISTLYWLFSISVYVGLAWALLNYDQYRIPGQSHYFFTVNALVMMSLLSKLVFVLFHGMEDIGYFVTNIISKAFASGKVSEGGDAMSRGKFLTYVGAGLAAVPFGAIAYGMVKGRYDFRVVRKNLTFKNLPKAFDGLKVVQISDIHIGSFPQEHPSVQKAVEMVNQLDADVLLFTGDLVNNLADETTGWVEVLKQMKAKHGKYAILGNHDYGDYVPWTNTEDRRKNLDGVKQANRDMGFDLLLNENRILEKDGEQIALIGVENWGRPPFPQYGDLRKASEGTEQAPFRILMSHDPSHWDGEVLDTNIDLTLSGHTHGMQFGIEIPGVKWSPVKYKYPRWGGLYQEGKQFLYVNRGFGYHAIAGRIGMPPEITEITLKSEAEEKLLADQLS
ncbi:metallophosphoesterase [Limibacter armeniacum]|uniref:metallophosphoesterase n=1 Tax=Limibacter armeniacum TaxID=466084 RepID=UPI002FE52912